MRLAVLVLSALAAAMALALGAGEGCYEGCRFHICGSPLPLRLDVLRGAADAAVTPPLCDKDGHTIGVVGGTGELRVVASRDARRLLFVPVAEWHRGAPPTAIKAYGAEGLGHQVLSAGVQASLRGRCVALPLHAWQVLDERGRVVRNEHTPWPREPHAFVNCVAFVVA